MYTNIQYRISYILYYKKHQMWVNMQHFQFSSMSGKDKVKQNEPHIKDMLYNIIIILISNYYNTIYPLFSLSLLSPYSLWDGLEKSE